ncbi:EAL domain-containing protein [Acidovorax sp. Root217]|uniref:EAL domain-containing protein n=1 Tax=Acidovorax sp. Root217 TaxID=1736492 RepID=UPI00070BA53A|nr:EAL domain-containing protein [Acidovorax sp. Root217]KRC20847.1 PAS domain S-box protein [Acidovorax sp. Root217]
MTNAREPPGQGPLRSTLRITWPFLLMVLLLAACASGSLYVLSAVRAFVAGESLWTKGQKDAIYYLDRYAATGSPDAYAQYRKAVEAPLGDKAARLALLESHPIDLNAAREGFARGENHPDDIDSLIWLLRWFHHFEIMQQPLAHWLVGDQHIASLQLLAEEIRQGHAAGLVDAATRRGWQASIRAINAGATPAARAFSTSLGDSSRRIVQWLLWANMGMAAVLILLTTWHTRALLAQRQRAELALDAEREQAHVTLAAIGDAVVTTDLHGRVLYLNPAAEALVGMAAQEATGRPLAQVLQLNDGTGPLGADQLVERVLRGGPTHRDGFTPTVVRPDQSLVPIKLVGSPIHHQAQPRGVVLVLHDVTREQHYVEQLSWQASHDALTGLVNRREFERRLEALLAQPRAMGREGALLYVDLDQFKLINDTCGHQAGDEMLRGVCRMLQSHLREGDTLARLGGDEFGILLKDCPPGPSARIAEQLRQAGHELRVLWEGRQLSTGLSIGMVQLIPALSTIQEAMRVADMACYRAKEGGRNQVFIYQAEDIEMSRREGDMDWVRRLRLALEHDRFRLYAQTITALQGASMGMHLEVLLRLAENHEELVSPGCFIPAAEHYGMMPAIDRWVVRHTLALLAQHQATDGLPVHTCAINLSGTSLGDESLLKYIRSEIEQSGVDAHRLCFEITETSAISHLPSAVRLMKDLQQLGCRFALDDFGVGMSSFTYLKHLPVDYLKIDGSFVRDLLDDPTNRAMVEMINHIGHVMGKETIAEFAESTAIVDALRSIGVDHAQGYALSRPVPLADCLRGS